MLDRLPPSYDPSNPDAYLTRLGTPTQTHLSKTVDVAGVPTRREGRTHTYQVRGSVLGTFSAEDRLTRLTRLFRPEMQTGDAEFDAAVFVSTTTPVSTGQWLASEDVRRALIEVTRHGGDVEVMDGWVAITVLGAQDGEVLPAGPLAALLAHLEATRA